jgi:NUMOD4 motif/HNH endonuclease
MQEEVWKDVTGYEGFYQVSNLANVRSLDRVETLYRPDIDKTVIRPRKGRLLKQKLTDKGYYSVHLRDKVNELESWPSVHRLVALSFIPNTDDKPTINHINGIKTDNSISNLEWATQQEQTVHAFETGLMFVRGNTLYDEDFKEKVISYHKETGQSYNKIAEHFKMSPRSVSRIVKGLWGDKRKPHKSLLSKARWLREQNFTLFSIAKITEMSISAIHRYTKAEV